MVVVVVYHCLMFPEIRRCIFSTKCGICLCCCGVMDVVSFSGMTCVFCLFGGEKVSVSEDPLSSLFLLLIYRPSHAGSTVSSVLCCRRDYP